MTVTTNPPAAQPPAARPPATPVDHVTLAIDGIDVVVPRGTLIIRAAEQVGVEIPRFCDHPLLEPVAACRACLVEIEGQPKPQPACAIPVADGMKVRTATTSPMADTAQRGVLEFLLINHPLDCPVCDKGGECPLQNQAMSHGRGESRFTLAKRTFPKPVALSSQILIDRERCVSCARCTRFADQVAGDPFISLQQRGGRQIVGTAQDTPFNSYFSGNTVQICPVGALTSAAYRFRSRPFDLVSTPTVCEHCASGCALRTDVRRSTVLRRLAWDDPAVNSEWNCDKGRFAFPYLAADRLDTPLVADGDGSQREASWSQATRRAAEALAAAGPRTVVLTGGRLTLEDSYAYAKFARAVVGTDSIDFRARASSAEEADLLRTVVAGSGLGVTYADLDAAPTVLLVGLEPEEESPIIFLRLRAATRKGRTRVYTVACHASPGSAKLGARVLAAVPGQEPGVLSALGAGPGQRSDSTLEGPDLRAPGSVILIGERAAQVPGTITAAAALAASTGARLAWVPRRAGERGALEAGALPGLLPWGRPLADPTARAQVADAWGVDAEALPSEPGMDLVAFLAAVAADQRDARAAAESASEHAGSEHAGPAPRVAALVLAGVEADDLPDPEAFRAAVRSVPFVLSLETRSTELTELADVVLPVGVVTEKSGTFLDWEGRARPFGQVMRQSAALTDARALSLVARALGRPMGSIEVAELRAEIAGLGRWQGARPPVEPVESLEVVAPVDGQVVLASWRHLLDLGRLQAGEEALAGTARPALARMSAATANAAGLADGQPVTITSPHGSLTLPVAVTEMVDAVVLVPGNSPGSTVNASLRVGPGTPVAISAGGAQ